MASSRNDAQLTWSAATTKDISSASNATSDAYTFNAEDWDADLQIVADNQGTPASGDNVNCYVMYSPDGSSFDTVEHAQFIGVLDTLSTDTPGEDPATLTVPLRTASRAFKLYTVNASSGRTIRVSARIVTHRPQ